MAWWRIGTKPLCEPVMRQLIHAYVSPRLKDLTDLAGLLVPVLYVFITCPVHLHNANINNYSVRILLLAIKLLIFGDHWGLLKKTMV